jgi:hypothetical protein
MTPDAHSSLLALAVGLLSLALLGAGASALLRRVRILPAVGRAEAAGLCILLALAAVPWLCVTMDLVGLPITRVSLGAASVLIALAGLVATRRGPRPTARVRPPQAEPADMRARDAGRTPWRGAIGAGLRAGVDATVRSPAAALLALAVASIVLFSLAQVAIYPPREHDALVGFDVVGKVLSYEGVYRSSVFTKLAFNAQCVYPPFTAANQGFWYLFHPAIARLWVPLLAAGFALVFWSRVRAWTGSRTAAGLATFLTLLVPELAFHLTVGQTDLPSMVYVSLGIFALIDRVRGRARLAAAALFLLFATTARSENVLFAVALAPLGVLVLRARRAAALLVPVPALAFFVFWNLIYVRTLIGLNPSEYFLNAIPADPGRLAYVVGSAARIIADPANFGELVWLLPITVTLWVAGRRSRHMPAGMGGSVQERDITGLLLAILGLSMLFYLPFFYMWNEQRNPLWLMHYTFKRGFFRFVPGLLAAFVTAPPVCRFLRRCDGEAGVPAGG